MFSRLHFSMYSLGNAYIIHYFNPLVLLHHYYNTLSKMVCNYLQILIFSNQLLPGKYLIGLDAFQAMPHLFILENPQCLI